ncbi:Protein ULTRAPETALA 2 [Linum grandiflorum]
MEEAQVVFVEPQLQAMEGFSRLGPNHIKVTCGCTSRRFGDCFGVLTVFSSGQFIITCHCKLNCIAEEYTPYEFEKHARGPLGSSKWKSHIWVAIDGKKVALWKTELFKYYRHGANGGSGCIKRQFHRDEFITCSLCKKQRRFRLRTREQCRVFHDALLSEATWKCDDMPSQSFSCGDVEERDSRKRYKGCRRAAHCRGCTICVCVGCLICRFADCNCRTCVDFMQNADA